MAMTPQEIQNRIGRHFPGQAGIELYLVLSQLVADIAAASGGDAAAIAALNTSVGNLNAWGTALATKLNAQFVVANAEATLPFSPALAVDYDTNPQA